MHVQIILACALLVKGPPKARAYPIQVFASSACVPYLVQERVYPIWFKSVCTLFGSRACVPYLVQECVYPIWFKRVRTLFASSACAPSKYMHWPGYPPTYAIFRRSRPRKRGSQDPLRVREFKYYKGECCLNKKTHTHF